MSELELLQGECQGCQRCELGRTRTNLVFGTGNEKARLMFVGEGPGEQEDLQGIPSADDILAYLRVRLGA